MEFKTLIVKQDNKDILMDFDFIHTPTKGLLIGNDSYEVVGSADSMNKEFIVRTIFVKELKF